MTALIILCFNAFPLALFQLPFKITDGQPTLLFQPSLTHELLCVLSHPKSNVINIETSILPDLLGAGRSGKDMGRKVEQWWAATERRKERKGKDGAAGAEGKQGKGRKEGGIRQCKTNTTLLTFDVIIK